MNHQYEIDQIVHIVKNDKQPWTVGKEGKVASQIEDVPPWEYCGPGPYYYIFVEHSEYSSSGCVLPESALQELSKKYEFTLDYDPDPDADYEPDEDDLDYCALCSGTGYVEELLSDCPDCGGQGFYS